MPDSNATPPWQAYAERVLARLAARGATDDPDREDSAPGAGARSSTSARGEDTSGSGAARSETSPVRPATLHQRIVALRLAVALGDEAAMARRCAPGALSILTGLEDEEARIGAELLQRGLFLPGRRYSDDPWHVGRAGDLLVVVPRRLSYESAQRVAEYFHQAITQALERPGAVLLVVPGRGLLPTELEETGPAPLRVPPLDGAQLALLLAQRYGRSAQADIAPIRPRLPGDAAVAALPLTVLQLALRAPSLEAALARIAQATAPRRSDGPDLDAMTGDSSALIAARRLVADLRLWQAGTIDWSELSHSLLLYGPPGTGKTWLARAMANSAGIAAIEGSFAEWQAAGHLGNLLHEMRNTFERARRSAPAVLVIDEIDAVGSRTSSDTHGRSYRTQVVNAFLTELDAVAREPGVIVVGTCNHRETIDPAVLRPGRLDIHIEMPLPDGAAIHGILTRHLGEAIPPAELYALATDAIGRSAAEIDAAVRAARADARHTHPPADRPVDPARIRAHLGIASTPHSDAMRWRSAVHECGHALVCAALGLGTVQRVLLTPGGGEILRDRDAREGLLPDVEAELALTLAGRAAERLVLGTVSAGSGGPDESDLAVATRIAIAIDTALGLGAHGPTWSGTADPHRHLGDPDLRARVRTRLEAAEERATRILQAYSDHLTRMARALLAARELRPPALDGWLAPITTHAAAPPDAERRATPTPPAPDPASLDPPSGYQPD